MLLRIALSALKCSAPEGAPRVQSAVRNQVELRACDLDSALPAEHQARAVWAFVQSLDLSTPCTRASEPSKAASGGRRSTRPF